MRRVLKGGSRYIRSTHSEFMPRRTEMLSSIQRVRFKKLAFSGGGGGCHYLVRLPAGLRCGRARKGETRQDFGCVGTGDRAPLPASTGTAESGAAASAVQALKCGHRIQPLAALPGETWRRRFVDGPRNTPAQGKQPRPSPSSRTN